MCLSPIHLYNLEGNRRVWYDVPCGKCVECKSSRRNQYVLKLYNEFLNCSNAYFVTLTYNVDHVPYVISSDTGEINLTLDIGDFQRCIKRVRRQYYYKHKSNFKVVYFICGEYGSRTHRPHYHLVLFNVDDDFLSLFKSDWVSNCGFVQIKQIGMSQRDFVRSSLYVSKYVVKKDFDPLLVDYSEVVEKFKGRKMFVSTSHFFGQNYDWDFLFQCNFGAYSSLDDMIANFKFWHIDIFGKSYKLSLSVVDKLTTLKYNEIFEKLHLENESRVSRFDWYVFARLLSRIGWLNANKERLDRYSSVQKTEDYIKLVSMEHSDTCFRSKLLSERFRFRESDDNI